MTSPLKVRPDRWWDVRILVIFLYVSLAVFIMYLLLHFQSASAHRSDVRFEREYVAICKSTNAANAKFNGVLDQLSKNAQNTTGITPAQKIQAIQTYASLHLPIIACPR